MICKERPSDVHSIGGGGVATGAIRQAGASTHCNTLQNRRKSQLITFSSSSCDIKSSLSHEIILVNNSQYSNSNNNHKTTEMGSFGVGAGAGLSGRASITSSCNNQPNARLSYAEEDMLLVSKGAGSGSASGGSGSGSASAGSGHEADLEDDVFRRRSLEVEDDEDNDEDVDFDDEFGTRIERSNNANDDSGGGSYEDSHALQSSIGGSNRNSLEKDDDDDIDVDVISTDVSCYDQLLGSSCNTRNDDDIATIMGDAESYTKLCKTGSITRLNGGGGGVGGLNVGGGGGGVGENSGIIYANPFMDDEGIAESGM